MSTAEAIGLMPDFGGLIATIIFGIVTIVTSYINTNKITVYNFVELTVIFN